MKRSTDSHSHHPLRQSGTAKGSAGSDESKDQKRALRRQNLRRRIRSAVAEVVRKQVESGIDIVTDGEQGKPGFFAYVRERLNGFEAKTPAPGGWKQWAAEVAAFPGVLRELFQAAHDGR